MQGSDIKFYRVSLAVPGWTPSWERVFILGLNPERLDTVLDFHRCVCLAVATLTILFNHDYVPSLRVILDFEAWTMSHILQVNINDLFKLMEIYQVP
jgi:hypothetical protein